MRSLQGTARRAGDDVVADLVTVTCEQHRFMSRRIVHVYDRNAPVGIGDRVRVDNRQGAREGTIRTVDFMIRDGRKKRRLQIYLDEIPVST